MKEMKNGRLLKRKEGNKEENLMMIFSYKNFCDNCNNKRLVYLNMYSEW